MRGLLLAEKPSVMRAIQEVYKKEQASLQDDLEFGAFHGHLMEMKDPEDYNAAWANRSDVTQLPMIPAAFSYKPSDVDSVNRLMSKIRNGHYDFLINGCDAGREGEHIFWSFYETMGLTLPVKRLWASSVTKPALRKALHNLQPASTYDGMRTAAKLRAQFDWLVGMNFTRAATSSMQRFVPIGRVQSPTLKLIVDRELEIQNFQPETFHEVKAGIRISGTLVGGCLHLVAPDHKTTRFADKQKAEAVANAVRRNPNGVVIAVNEKVQEAEAPTLYSLAELEKDANKYLKFTPKKTDSIAQKLYENGFITYPRSESRYLPTDMIPEIPAHLAVTKVVPELTQIASGIGQKEIDAMLKKHYVDDAGITDHHAVIPTDSAPVWANLTKEEQQLYTLVCKSFLAIFLPPYKAEITQVVFDFSGHLFGAKGRKELDKGYSILYPTPKSNDVVIPPCAKGDKVTAEKVTVTTGTTKPPLRYTPRTILAAMQNAGSDLPDAAMRSVLRESAGLGTSATRAEILQKLEDRKLVEVKNNHYFALAAGINIIQGVGTRTFCSPELTAQWEEKLRKIEKGAYTGNFQAEMQQYVQDETAFLLSNVQAVQRRVVGKCPVCGGNIIELDNSFQCENRKKNSQNSCTIGFSKTMGGYTFTDDDIKALLAMKKTSVKEVTTKFKTIIHVEFFLDAQQGLMLKRTDEIIGACPICGKSVIAYPKTFSCEANTKENPMCSFWISRVVGGYALTEDEGRAILKGEATAPRVIKNNNGQNWRVSFRLGSDKKLKLVSEEKKPLGKCPSCGADVYAGANNFYCSNHDCNFGVAKNIKGAKLSEKDMKDLLAGKKTRVLTFTWASGNTGQASLYLQKARLCWAFTTK